MQCAASPPPTPLLPSSPLVLVCAIWCSQGVPVAGLGQRGSGGPGGHPPPPSRPAPLRQGARGGGGAPARVSRNRRCPRPTALHCARFPSHHLLPGAASHSAGGGTGSGRKEWWRPVGLAAAPAAGAAVSPPPLHLPLQTRRQARSSRLGREISPFLDEGMTRLIDGGGPHTFPPPPPSRRHWAGKGHHRGPPGAAPPLTPRRNCGIPPHAAQL